MTIDDYLHSMQVTFSPERTRGKHAVLQYVFTGSQRGVCHAVVDDGILTVAHGEHPQPSAAVSADFDLWMRIVAYQEDGWLAYQAGKFTVTGDLELLMESDTWFIRPSRA
jgi:putative sterol carrier protein